MSETTADSGEPFGTDENFAVMFEEAMAKSAIAEGTVEAILKNQKLAERFFGE